MVSLLPNTYLGFASCSFPWVKCPLNLPLCLQNLHIFHKAQHNSHLCLVSIHIYFSCYTLANYYVPFSTSFYIFCYSVLFFRFSSINVISLTSYAFTDSRDSVFWRGKVKCFVEYPSIWVWLVSSHIYKELWIWGKNITRVKYPSHHGEYMIWTWLICWC